MYENKKDSVEILLVGNNPMEMSDIYENLLKYKRGILNAAIAFELQGLLSKIIKIRPRSIVIDDKYGREELKSVINSLLHNAKTRHIPITVIKNSNHEEPGDLGADDFVLKHNLSATELMASIRNAVKFRAARNYFNKTHSNTPGFLTSTLGQLAKFKSAASF